MPRLPEVAEPMNQSASFKAHLPWLWDDPSKKATADDKRRLAASAGFQTGGYGVPGFRRLQARGRLVSQRFISFFFFCFAHVGRPHEKQLSASWYGPGRARTTGWCTAELLQCAIVVGPSFFTMSSCGLVVTRIQDLQALPTEFFPNVCMQCLSALRACSRKTLRPLLLRRTLELVQNGDVSSRCLCQQGDERSGKL